MFAMFSDLRGAALNQRSSALGTGEKSNEVFARRDTLNVTQLPADSILAAPCADCGEANLLWHEPDHADLDWISGPEAMTVGRCYAAEPPLIRTVHRARRDGALRKGWARSALSRAKLLIAMESTDDMFRNSQRKETPQFKSSEFYSA
jgi:hypothetical protein